jgi:hypothetical protein
LLYSRNSNKGELENWENDFTKKSSRETKKNRKILALFKEITKVFLVDFEDFFDFSASFWKNALTYLQRAHPLTSKVANKRQ